MSASEHTASYRAGSSLLVSAPRVWLLADISPGDPLVPECYGLMSDGGTAEEVVGLIARDGLGKVANFALAGADDGGGYHVLLRGTGTAHTEGGAERSGAGAPTWISFDEPAATLVLALGHDAETSELPIGTGIVAAASCCVRSDAVPATPAEPAAPTAPIAPIASVAPVAPVAQPNRPITQTWSGDTAPATAAGAETMSPPPSPAGLIDATPWMPAPPAAPPEHSYQPAPQTPAYPPTLPQPVPPPQPAIPPPVQPPVQPPVESPVEPAVAPPAQHSAQHSAPDGSPAAGDLLAVSCPYGHLSPPHVGECRVCGTVLPPQEPFVTARPVLGLLNLSTGDVVTLDRDVVLGRAPSAAGADPARQPHLVRLSSPDNDISRNHLDVRLDGWHVLITDLGSTNGTIATLPGQQPLRLRPHDALAIVPGTIVNIADEVSFRYEVPS